MCGGGGAEGGGEEDSRDLLGCGYWLKKKDQELIICVFVCFLVWEVAAEADRRERRDKDRLLAAQGGTIRQSIEERKKAADGLHSQ